MMEQISQQVSQSQPIPSPISRSSRWLIIVVATFIILLILGGTSYYYLEVYYSAQYARAVVPIYNKVTSQQVIAGNLKGSSDYEGLLVSLDQYYTFLSQINDGLSNLKPSPINTTPSFLTNTKRSEQIQEDFTKILEEFMSNVAKAKKQAQVMIKAKELILLLRPDLTAYPPPAVPAGQGTPSPPPPSTAGEFLSVWEARVPKAKVVAKGLFSDPQDLGDASFDELKSLWLETEQGFDVIIPFLKKQDPNLSISEAQKLVPESDKTVFAKVDKIDELLPRLENVLIRNSGENILRHQFEFNNSKKEGIAGSFIRLDTNIKQLKEKYGE